MNQIRLKNTSDDYFQSAWALYEDAFPLAERRLLDAQSKAMKKDIYHFVVIIEEEQLIGILLWWEFDNYRFIEHFATTTKQRNKGFGKRTLEKIMDHNDKPILLEVELPDSTINQRRIHFYERIGFKLNEHYYEMPPLIEGQLPVQLLLMSYPGYLSTKDVEEFIKIGHPIILKD